MLHNLKLFEFLQDDQKVLVFWIKDTQLVKSMQTVQNPKAPKSKTRSVPSISDVEYSNCTL